jgi:hypothetical protein
LVHKLFTSDREKVKQRKGLLGQKFRLHFLSDFFVQKFQLRPHVCRRSQHKGIDAFANNQPLFLEKKKSVASKKKRNSLNILFGKRQDIEQVTSKHERDCHSRGNN